jgi:PKD repeat protein
MGLYRVFRRSVAFRAHTSLKVLAALLACLASATLVFAQPPPPPPTLVSIAVTPAMPSIALGAQQQFTATGTFSDNSTQNITAMAQWSSSLPTVASVANDPAHKGLATAVGAGTTTITATSGMISGSTTLTVTNATLLSITITPHVATIALGTTQQFTAVGFYSDGSTQNVTNSAHWTSTRSAVATISNSDGTHGLATSKAIGTTTIGASLQGLSDSATLTVSAAALVSISVTPSNPTIPLGKTEQFAATGTYTDQSTKNITAAVTWSSSSASVAVISNSPGTNGLATSASQGTTTITATSGAISGATTLTVAKPALVSIAISPTNSSVIVGTTRQFTATGTYTDGSSQNITTSVTWSSDALAVASINSAGLATAVAPGTADISASSGTVTNSTTLTVTGVPGPSCSLQLSSASGSAPLTVTATAACQGGKGTLTGVISFGDGFYQTGLSATHTFASAGTFPVSVTATDGAGNSSKPASSSVSVSDAATFFVGVSNGQIQQFNTSGKLLKTLTTGQSGSVTGMGFDSADALYVTDFTADAVTKFDGQGNSAGNFGTGYNCQPESIVFDTAGNAYVGETGCSHALLKFDPYGNLVHGWSVTTEVEGSDWIDLAPDQCTIFYTSQGTTIFRFNACTGEQLPVFATGLHTALGLRILSDGGVLVADNQDLVRFDSAGRNIMTYTASGEKCWVSVTLDRDASSFWAVDYCTSDIIHFDLTSGNQLAKFNTGTPTETAFGIAMRGAVATITPAGSFVAAQQTLSVAAGQSTSLDLTFAPVGSAANQTFAFSCAQLPVGAKCSFSPQTAVATSSSTLPVQLTVSTTGATASLLPPFFRPPVRLALWLVLPGIVLFGGINKKRLLAGATFALIVVLVFLVACGGSSSSSNNAQGGGSGNQTPSPPNPSSLATPAGTYSIVIQATSNNLVSSTVVSLTVH